MKRALLLIIMFIIGSTVCPAGSEQTKSEANQPTAKDLVAKFAQTQENMNSFILRYEDHLQGQSKRGYLGEIRSDGKRHLFWEKVWGYRPDLPTNIEGAKKDVRANFYLWNGENWFQYFRSNSEPQRDSIFILQKHDYLGKGHGVEKDFKTRYLWDTLENFYYTVPFPNILTELQKTETIKLQPKKDKINGSDCFVIEAETNSSKFKIWIDPQHSYQIAAVEVLRTSQNIDSQKDDAKIIRAYIKDVKFKKFDDIWVPVEGNYGYTRQRINDSFMREDHHIIITDFQMNPDHQAKNSFEPVFIRNNSRVQIINGPRVVFTWLDGKVVDGVGKVIMDLTEKNK